MDPKLQDIVKHYKFYVTTRYQAAEICYPRIEQIVGPFKLLKNAARKNVTDTLSLEKMPSLSSCKEMQDYIEKGKFAVVSSNVGSFTKKSLETICKIHELRDISSRVEEEKSWLRKEISIPNEKCCLSKADMAKYEDLVFNSPDGRAVLDNNNFILSSDLATIAGTRWLHYSILAGFTKLLQATGAQTMVFMLNDLLQMRTDDLRQVVRESAMRGPKFITFFVHVTTSKAGEVYFASPQRPGCHWTLLYIDLTANKWFYCDTAGWNPPKDMKKVVSPIVDIIYEEGTVSIKPFKGILRGHVENKSHNSHVCSSKCLPNIPLQTCGNVCGVAVIFLAVIASCAPKLWREVFLVKNARLPDDLKWFIHPTSYSDFMRSKLISWLLEQRVEVASLGIMDHLCKKGDSGVNLPVDSASASNKSSKRSLKHEADVLEISDDDVKSYSSDESGCSDNMKPSDIESGPEPLECDIPVSHDTHEDQTEDGLTKIPQDTTDSPDENVDQNLECDTGISDDRGDDQTEHEVTGKPQDTSVFADGHLIADQPQQCATGILDDIIENLAEQEITKRPQDASDPPDDNSTVKHPATHRESDSIDPSEPTANNEDSACRFYVGQRFTELNDFLTFKKTFEDANFVELYKKDVRYLTSAAKRVPKRVAAAKPSLQYYSLLLYCKFGGQPNASKERTRKTKSFRQGCPFQVYLSLSADGQALEVARVNECHNHALTRQLYAHLPRQRAMTQEEKKEIKDALNLKANKKLLQQKVEGNSGKKITLKDISNIQQRTTSDDDQNNLDNVINFLQQQNGSITEVVVDQDNNFKGLVYQDEYMRSMFSKFPEIIMVDATYKLLDLRMPLYLLLAIDGDGSSEIVGLFILAEETQQVIESAVAIFKRFNTRWTDTKVIMSDKDFTERDAFKNCFPEASLNICLYHTLRSFRREITCEKLGITSAERFRCLELVSKLAYSKSEKEFNGHWDEIKATKLNSVIEYLELNWLPIKHQWVACFKDETLNLGENTNNRLESIFSKIKSVCSKYASLLQFFHEFFSVLRTLRNERNHHFLMAFARKPVENHNCDPVVKQYAAHLTPYAFQFVRSQLELSNAIKTENVSKKPEGAFEIKSSGDMVSATSSSCTCSFTKRMGLPCRHLFKVRIIMNLPLFEPDLVSDRWTLKYYEELADTRFSGGENTHFDVPRTTVTVTENRKSVLSQAQKFKKALRITQSLASLASEGGMITFTTRMRQLEDIVKHWSLGREITIGDEKSNDGKQNGQDEESEREVTGTTNEQKDKEEMEGKVQSLKKASGRKRQETNGQSTEKEAKSESEILEQDWETHEEMEGHETVREIVGERKRQETHGKRAGTKLKSERQGNEEKGKTDTNEQEEWNTEESQKQERSVKMEEQIEIDMNDTASQRHGKNHTKEEQGMGEEMEKMEKRRHKTKAKESDNDKGKTGENVNGRNEESEEASDCSLSSGFHNIKMPPRMMKRGRPKGAEVTVIGIPKTKKRKVEGSTLLPFNKLKPSEKERTILECITKNKVAVAEALSGRRVLDDNDIETNIHLIPDTVRDGENVDIFRLEKFFSEDAWIQVLDILRKKEETPWQCKSCSKTIKENQESIACDRCLLWYHFLCSSLSKKPKSRKWFCKGCKTKFN